MPELPEVETVKETLKLQVLNKVIKKVDVYYDNIVASPSTDLFVKKLINKKIINIERKGKWLIFDLGSICLLSHLRMEGKYYIRNVEDEKLKHEHVRFTFIDNQTLRYIDTRKFGKMYLVDKDRMYNCKPLSDLGKEPFDKSLDVFYLKSKYSNKKLPIKTVLLDQSIITGIGNIYADEILFLCKINPKIKCNLLTDKNLMDIIDNTKIVLNKAIKLGGSTIRSYSYKEGVHGLFQNELLVHTHEGENCKICGNKIIKVKINGRGTYYCENCQK